MTNKRFEKRRKVWVDVNIQGGLALRCTLYWFFCLCSIMLFVAIGTAFSGNLQSAGDMFSKLWRQFSPAILASVFLLPLVIIDVIRKSHRFVGPLIRLQNEMQRLADGQDVAPVHFRNPLRGAE